MKKECEIVQDLLFGYADGTLKNASKELVEQHLEHCNQCEAILKELKEDNKAEIDKQEVDYLKGINRKMNKKTIIITITTILLIILSIFHIIVYINYREYKENATIEIFLKEDITEEEKSNIEKAIKEAVEDAKITYKSSREALENLKQQFKEDSYLLDGYNENPQEIFPSSYIVKENFTNIKKIKEKVTGMSGVEHIAGQTPVNPYVLTYYNLFNK